MSHKHDARDVDPDAFAVHLDEVRDGVRIAYVHEGRGGVPLLMLHGWPSSKRIFYRNIGPLARAGFEVIAPDIGGWGDSPARGSGFADPTSAAHDFKALMERLGHQRWVTAAFDFGSVSAMHMANRFPEQVMRQVLWSALVPVLPDEYARLGVGGDMLAENSDVLDHITRHGGDPDGVARRYDTPDKRREFVKGFYQARVWKAGGLPKRMTAVGSFDDQTAAFHAEAFADAATFRASLHYYAAITHPEICFETPLISQKVLTETMFLHGTEDEIVGPEIVRQAEVGYPNMVGPFLVGGGGHFLSWERAAVVNSAITCFCRDLLAENRRERPFE